MTLFYDLYRSTLSPAPPDGPLGPGQPGADALFRSAVSNSPLRVWSPGEAVPAKGNRLLIGVATWSASDMRLLDAISRALRTPPRDLTVDVFNVADVPSPGGFKAYVPGITKVFHTPVVGLWSGGRLAEKASGKAGRELVARVCGLDLREIEQPPSGAPR